MTIEFKPSGAYEKCLSKFQPEAFKNFSEAPFDFLQIRRQSKGRNLYFFFHQTEATIKINKTLSPLHLLLYAVRKDLS